MRLIVAGSRTIKDLGFVIKSIDSVPLEQVTEVVSGGADGVDLLGETWANLRQIPVKRFLPDWKRDGRSAGIIRNVEMARYGDILVAVYDGTSPGTNHMVKAMMDEGKEIHVYVRR